MGCTIKYMGSKSRIADKIVPIIQKMIDDNGIKYYYEPFCGGCNIIDKIKCDNKIASDKHKYLIAMYQNLHRIKELPDFIGKDHYSDVRNCFNSKSQNYEDWYIGAVGFLASYNGRFFDGGYAGIVNTKTGMIRNYYDEAKRNLESQLTNLNGIHFICADYRNSVLFTNAFIYCDPPYAGTKQYGVSKDFNYDEFWEWVREQSKSNIVIVSEHTAPDDFKCIWEAPIKRTIDNTKRVNAVERLFQFH